MLIDTEIWCRNTLSGAVLKLAQTYHQQDRLAEALAICLKAIPLICPEQISENKRYNAFIEILRFAVSSLLEVLGDEQFSQIYRATKDYPVSIEELAREIEIFQSLGRMHSRMWTSSFDLEKQDLVIITIFKNAELFFAAQFNPLEPLALWMNNDKVKPFDPLKESIIATFPYPDSEFQQLSQIFLQSVRQKLTSGLEPLFSAFEVFYSERLQHLHLPSTNIYQKSNSFLKKQIEELENQETEEALKERNHYAFFRYLKTLERQTKPIYSVAVSPNGQVLATGGADNIVKLWNLEIKQQVATFTGHTDSVLSITFSPDGQILASSSADRTIKLWNVKTLEQLHTLTGHNHSVLSIAFSPNGQVLASSSVDCTIKLWNVQTGKELHTLTGHNHSILSVVFSPDGQTLASGGADFAIKLWNVQTGEEYYNLPQTSDCTYSLCFHPQGQMLVSSHRGSTLNIWNLNTYELSQTISLQDKIVSEIVSVAVSPDGKAIAGGGAGRNVIWIWNFDTGKIITTMRGYSDSIYHSDIVYDVDFIPDCSMLASASRDETVKLWGIPKPLNF
jgi:WD40 repeat protein